MGLILPLCSLVYWLCSSVSLYFESSKSVLERCDCISCSLTEVVTLKSLFSALLSPSPSEQIFGNEFS